VFAKRWVDTRRAAAAGLIAKNSLNGFAQLRTLNSRCRQWTRGQGVKPRYRQPQDPKADRQQVHSELSLDKRLFHNISSAKYAAAFSGWRRAIRLATSNLAGEISARRRVIAACSG